MSQITHLFDLNIESTEHHLISKSPNLTITAQGTAGEADVFMASKYGEYNHVKGFETGKDKIKVPLDVIKEVFPTTAIVKGPLPAERFDDDTNFDSIIYVTGGTARGRLQYVAADSANTIVALLHLDGDPAPTLAAGDIEIV